MADERDLTKVVETPGGSWYEVPASMVREGFADTAEEGLRTLKNLLMGATIGAEQTRTQPVWEEPLNAQEFGEVASMAMAPLAVGGRALLKRITNPIRAFHGSPHTFDQPYRFDLDKIGTGEGVQAYGPGGYFAENPRVAKTYHPANYEAESTLRRMARDAERAQDYESAEVIEDALRYFNRKEVGSMGDELRAMHGPEFEELIKRIESLPQRGGVYDVDLHVDPEQLIDLDLTVSQQPGPVREALADTIVARIDANTYPSLKQAEQLFDSTRVMIHEQSDIGIRETIEKGRRLAEAGDVQGFRRWFDAHGDYLSPGRHRDMEAERIYNYVSPHPAASGGLRDLGIPGARYWDGFSRDAGRGSRNYVIWDPDVIDVRKKLAALLAVGGGATAADAFDQTPVEFGR